MRSVKAEYKQRVFCRRPSAPISPDRILSFFMGETMVNCIHLMSRKVAKTIGVTYYFTGRPCKNGHIYTRNTKSGDCHMCAKTRHADWYQINKERSRLRLKTWIAENQGKVKTHAARTRRKIKNDPDKKRKYNLYMRAINRARQRKISSGQTREISEWIAASEKTCFYCKVDCQDDFHVDHFYPLSRGGGHCLENLVIACATCNLKKSNKCPHEFIDSLKL